MSIVINTPLEDHRATTGLLVKREDLCCLSPGPPFSKMRGVVAHVASRPEEVIGVLDTSHSQAGWAVAYACRLVGKECINYYPVYKRSTFSMLELQPQQRWARDLGAQLVCLAAARSAIMFHRAKKLLAAVNRPSYMMPNALKLRETVEETAEELRRTFATHGDLIDNKPILIPISSGTIAAGVLRGLQLIKRPDHPVILHSGYSRSRPAVLKYVHTMSGTGRLDCSVDLIDERYGYADQARLGPTPQWPCNPFYDLKTFRWWMKRGRAEFGEAVLWNIG
jgi:hypothetical protein